MPIKSPKDLAALQKNPSAVRNICILAHVDHGKTTLADALVASNGIISQRMAGKMRYMDSREDEQTRGITMKSSAISLFYEQDQVQFLVNLIDSPGHVDFSSEVSTAVRLCDGAILIVDVVEGVSPQTHAVLRQVWLENIRPILVLNKMDRLITEMKMTPLEAFYHLQQILVEVNLLTNQLFTSDAMERTSAAYDWTTIEDEDDEKNIFFSPDRGNVIFASALDGWGFTINHFAEMYAVKLNINKAALQKTLWGDYFVNMKAQRVVKGAQSKGKKPLFVQFVLENIWAMYDAIVEKRDKEMTEKIIKSLGLKVAPRDMKHSDSRVQLQAIAAQWLPVSNAVLAVVAEQLPSPLQMSEERVEKLMCSQNRQFDSFPPQTRQLKMDFLACSSEDDAPVIIYVSKMFPVERKSLPQNKPKPLTEQQLQERAQQARQRYAMKIENQTTSNLPPSHVQNGESEKETTMEETVQLLESDSKCHDRENDNEHVFVAFARVFSGAVRQGQRLYVLGPKHDPGVALIQNNGESVGDSVRQLSSEQHITSFIVQDLYMFMGRELEQLDCVLAGNVLGIGGLENHILKSATISSTVACPAFTDMYFDAAPIMRVAVEPVSPSDMSRLVEGLRLLNQADPCVRVLLQETGEHVIVTAGEVHLQRCIDDLRERYARVEINVSKPIVPFRETIIPKPRVDMVNEAIQDQNTPLKVGGQKDFENDEEVVGEGLVEIYTPNQLCMIRICAVPLPLGVVDCILRHQEVIKTLDAMAAQCAGQNSDLQTGFQVQETARRELKTLHQELQREFELAGSDWTNTIDHIWSFGPRRNGPNILLNRIPGYKRLSVWSTMEANKLDEAGAATSEIRQYDSSIIAGFQMATQAGPLCEEPMHGVCFIIEEWKYLDEDDVPSVKDIHISEFTKEHTDNSSLSSSSHVEHTTSVKSSTDEAANAGEKRERRRKKDVFGPMSGQLMSVVKDGCRKAFQTMPQRLMVAMYRCTIQATTDVLGKLYAVIGKRNGRVIAEELKEGTQVFNIKAEFPIVESFGLAEEMRKRTSGLANPQLSFSHWEVLDVDPFWVPSTEEEYMLYGEKADSENRALVYMNEVRRRKGLRVDEKIVEFAEKQRTLTRKK
ncbi:hypothetical protein C0Q70_20311 [Pomacea canaliculata]|uniref:Ribosome assembly protein 1 n=1 Tax=Pomacea canaliculata TaxID=400727 RepID=A0A2T7NF78_POMCA|nr:hypothetical protein C0Q70_20311 [Pomacea canaliculata]